jgi:DNA-damage-inducible protein D
VPFLLPYGREWRGGEEEVIKKAKEACANSQYKVDDHFVDMHEMVEIEKSGKPLKSLAERCLKTCLWLIA